jgi:hypothetical protein
MIYNPGSHAVFQITTVKQTSADYNPLARQQRNARRRITEKMEDKRPKKRGGGRLE